MVLEPFATFECWLDDAQRAGLPEPGAAALATSTPEGRPSARMVLLKGFDENGFLFATHYGSRKAQELEANPRGALVFFWQPLERQVRIEGNVRRATGAESDAIFAARPRGARVGAWASPQSEPIPDREFLEQRVREIERRFPDEVPRPDFWGAYRLTADSIEFWHGQPQRLHDRQVYRLQPDGRWVSELLAP